MEQRKKLLSATLSPPEHDTTLLVRVRYLIWVESMINIGCHFGPDDLTAATWDQLFVLNIERSFVDRLVEHHRDKDRQQQDGLQDGLNKARAHSGAPPPGGTMFSHSRPFK